MIDGNEDWHGPVVVVSTHFDDAALSVGGFLQTVRGPKTVVTVHGGRPDPDAEVASWDLDCGFVTASDSYETRLAEDRAACRALGAEQVVLPNPDSTYRRPGPLAGLPDFLRGLPVDASVLLPLGTSQPDHTAVREACLEVLGREGGKTPMIYADLPYAAALVENWRHAPLAEIDASLRQGDRRYREMVLRYAMKPRLDVVLDADAWKVKRQAIFGHASQLSLVGSMGEIRHMGPMMRYPGVMQRELIWSTQPLSPR